MLAQKLLAAFSLLGFIGQRAKADAGLPLIQISHDDLGDDYPEMREEVHLEDFFWTGSGDGPPDYLKKVHTGINKGKEVVVKTETVVATVYVDGNNEIDIPICLDCPPDDGGGNWALGGIPPMNYSATDRRYWLLTVMSGFYSQKDNPILEEKLARLYRLAFTRQQSKHLGINGAQQISGISIATSGNERSEKGESEMSTPINFDSDVEILDMNSMNITSDRRTHDHHPHNKNSELEISSEEVENESTSISTTISQTPDTTVTSHNDSNTDPAYVTSVPWELIQQDAKSEKLNSPIAIAPQISTQMLPKNVYFRDEHVRVLIHNITRITEDEVQKGIRSSTAYDEDVNEKIDERPVANQTELIYSVFVNGRPVLAVTAANDMKLVSETEAANVIGNQIFMKAEPYLREPQATPLAPAIHSDQSGFITSIQNNTALVVVSSVAILLLFLLFIALLLMGRSRARERKKLEEHRTSSRNELLSEIQSGRPTSTEIDLGTGRSTTQSRDVGVQNFSFEHENGHYTREARIHFPGPPPEHDSRRDSLTSTDNTSDSSVYCPINPPAPDVQRMLDEKAATLFDKHKRRHYHQYDHAEGRDDVVYTSVASEKKHDKSRRKTRRRYLSENRVGSLETSPKTQRVNSSGDEVVGGSMDDENLSPTYANYERNEAYNPHNNYHRNKLLHQKTAFHDKDLPEDIGEQLETTEAINKEIIRALQPAERSSDTGSIGSFLSMASVKAFPKNTLPQPLNRVLDPVFVTYYDNVDDLLPVAKKPLSTKYRGQKDPLDATTISTIDNFPAPKAPRQATTMASQSDNPDPGVVGPIVWERHKKHLNESRDIDDMKNGSPVRDPAAIRTHYEGLLEGAIQMYSSQDDLPTPLPTLDFTNRRNLIRRENRGSSAGVSSYVMKGQNMDGRPATAQPEKTTKSNQSTQPPSPTVGAWGGSLHGSQSPLVRPLSAGPFHRPVDVPIPASATKSASARSDLSAAPLIEAIKTELRKFKQETN